METQISNREIAEKLARLQSDVDNIKLKIEGINTYEDNFSDVVILSEDSLKEVWDNKEDEIWNEYLKQ